MQIVDAGGGKGRSPRSVVAERGVVKCPVATAVQHGPQVVASCIQTAELLFYAGLRQVATVGDVAGVLRPPTMYKYNVRWNSFKIVEALLWGIRGSTSSHASASARSS